MVFLVLLCLALAVLLGGGYYAYRVAFWSPKKGREDLPVHKGKQYEPHLPEIARLLQTLIDRPCEFVSVTSYDGLTLWGRYYHLADGAPLDIAFHGYRSAGLTDFCGGAEISREMGHNLLLIDQRAHGKSQGSTITFGIKERYDVLTWVDYALERFGKDTKILLYGISMGASTVLMASELPLPENVKGIVADCPYSSPTKIIRAVGRKLRIPAAVAAVFSRRSRQRQKAQAPGCVRLCRCPSAAQRSRHRPEKLGPGRPGNGSLPQKPENCRPPLPGSRADRSAAAAYSPALCRPGLRQRRARARCR